MYYYILVNNIYKISYINICMDFQLGPRCPQKCLCHISFLKFSFHVQNVPQLTNKVTFRYLIRRFRSIVSYDYRSSKKI